VDVPAEDAPLCWMTRFVAHRLEPAPRLCLTTRCQRVRPAHFARLDAVRPDPASLRDEPTVRVSERFGSDASLAVSELAIARPQILAKNSAKVTISRATIVGVWFICTEHPCRVAHPWATVLGWAHLESACPRPTIGRCSSRGQIGAPNWTFVWVPQVQSPLVRCSDAQLCQPWSPCPKHAVRSGPRLTAAATVDPALPAGLPTM
jgi:hypothetical protein